MAQATESKPVGKPAGSEPKAVSWDDVADTTLSPTSGSQERYEDVPRPIRDLVEDSNAEYDIELVANGVTVKAGTPKFRVYKADSAARAHSFREYLKLAARTRPEGRLTIRFREIEGQPNHVRFAAGPFTPRGRASSK